MKRRSILWKCSPSRRFSSMIFSPRRLVAWNIWSIISITWWPGPLPPPPDSASRIALHVLHSLVVNVCCEVDDEQGRWWALCPFQQITCFGFYVVGFSARVFWVIKTRLLYLPTFQSTREADTINVILESPELSKDWTNTSLRFKKMKSAFRSWCWCSPSSPASPQGVHDFQKNGTGWTLAWHSTSSRLPVCIVWWLEKHDVAYPSRQGRHWDYLPTLKIVSS